VDRVLRVKVSMLAAQRHAHGGAAEHGRVLHMAVFCSVDQEYARCCQRHHDEHATLRVLCVTCNLTRRRT